MKKINLANVEEFKEFSNPSAGGYVCGIYNIEDVPEKEYLKIYYDILEGEFKGYYTKQVKEGRWKALPNFIASYKESALPFFKGTITSVEKSNNGFKFDNDETKLKGKKIGLVLFEQEYIGNDGRVKTSLKVDKAHSVDAIKKGDFEVPEHECVAQTTSTSTGAFGAKASSTANPFDAQTQSEPNPFENESNGFMDIPDSFNSEEELPFS